mmetsp:Transcript_40202/g.78255  ORF Transcript_40202/g.78255 Transcript_40202/m.78255 type:complete len:89 (+) Transcript_40202:93-359(+)
MMIGLLRGGTYDIIHIKTTIIHIKVSSLNSRLLQLVGGPSSRYHTPRARQYSYDNIRVDYTWLASPLWSSATEDSFGGIDTDATDFLA